MKIPSHIPLYGDPKFRGKCPREMVEQSSAVNRIRKLYPDTFGAILFHPRNESLVENGQHSAMIKHRAEGMTKGCVDLIIPGSPGFVVEIKRQNPQLSAISAEQIGYLEAAQRCGAFVAVCLGAVAVMTALDDYITRHYSHL